MAWRWNNNNDRRSDEVPRVPVPDFSVRVGRHTRGRRATDAGSDVVSRRVVSRPSQVADEGVAAALDVVAAARLWREDVGSAIDGALR